MEKEAGKQIFIKEEVYELLEGSRAGERHGS